MSDVIWGQLLESMRDATLDGRSWHEVARNIGTLFRSPAVALYGQSTDSKSFKETTVLGIDDRFIESYKHHYSHSDNPWVAASRFWRPGEIRTEQALQKLSGDRNVLRRSGYFQDWIAPQGYRHSMGMVVDRDSYGYVKLTLYRDAATGVYDSHEVARFEGICQQFRLMLDIAERYRLVRSIARLSLRALDQLDFGVLLLSSSGEVLEMNQFAGRLLQEASGLTLREGRLTARSRPAQSCVTRLISGRRPGAAAGVALVPPDVAVPINLTAVDGGSLEPDSGTLLFMHCPQRAFDERLQLLVERFALTAVERELARGLLQGSSLREAGAAAGLSYETSRWYVKQLFSKTDTHRQSELIRLLLTVKAELPDTTFH